MSLASWQTTVEIRRKHSWSYTLLICADCTALAASGVLESQPLQVGHIHVRTCYQ